MAKTQPLLSDEEEQALDGAVVRVEHQLREGRDLRCAVPPVAAVQEDRRAGLQQTRRAGSRLQQTGLELQPPRLLTSAQRHAPWCGAHGQHDASHVMHVACEIAKHDRACAVSSTT